jgi:hypothetical protein
MCVLLPCLPAQCAAQQAVVTYTCHGSGCVHALSPTMQGVLPFTLVCYSNAGQQQDLGLCLHTHPAAASMALCCCSRQGAPVHSLCLGAHTSPQPPEQLFPPSLCPVSPPPALPCYVGPWLQPTICCATQGITVSSSCMSPHTQGPQCVCRTMHHPCSCMQQVRHALPAARHTTLHDQCNCHQQPECCGVWVVGTERQSQLPMGVGLIPLQVISRFSTAWPWVPYLPACHPTPMSPHPPPTSTRCCTRPSSPPTFLTTGRRHCAEVFPGAVFPAHAQREHQHRPLLQV